MDREDVVGHLEGNAGFFQALRQPVVAVEIDLQAGRRPGRHADVAQPEGLIDEVEVVTALLIRNGGICLKRA